MENQTLIYAVDDENSIREVYKYALISAGFTPECFSCGKELFNAIEKSLPKLIILDIMLDGEDGYEILSRLKASPKTANIPVIMVSAKTTEIDKVRGLDLGADDYISKPFGVLELIARIKAKLRKTIPVAKVISYKGITINDDERTVTINGKVKELTLKQYELLKLLVSEPQKVLQRDDILDKVWGENYGETRTLDIHVGALRKIIADSGAKIATVRGVGYKIV
ncbi:MAG: response regulator transcription factor [Clostridia bacterium]|nr:response regulator transcription factor [Clostridia bacterium]